jgi:hypothetical protein
MGRCGEKMGGSGENMGGGESQEPVLHYSAELGGWDKAVGGGEVGGGTCRSGRSWDLSRTACVGLE